jgi:hypothetical protein
VKLWAIYIGGEHPQAHIEIHDVRFVSAVSIKATHDQLRAEWWGTPGTLHIDCYAEIAHADGWDVSLRPEPSAMREKLWFVNLGGYDGKDFAEQHRNMFVVATSMKEAKKRALSSIAGWKDAHRDDIYEAEKVFALDGPLSGGLHIHLTPGAVSGQPPFICRYTPLK